MVKITQALGNLSRARYIPPFPVKTSKKTPKPEIFFRRLPMYRMTSTFRLRSRNCYTIAKGALEKELLMTAAASKMSTAMERNLRITRIEGALLPFGMTYEHFMETLAKMNILVNRKILADFGIWEPRTFKSLVTLVNRKSDMEDTTSPYMKANRIYPADSALVKNVLEF